MRVSIATVFNKLCTFGTPKIWKNTSKINDLLLAWNNRERPIDPASEQSVGFGARLPVHYYLYKYIYFGYIRAAQLAILFAPMQE